MPAQSETSCESWLYLLPPIVAAASLLSSEQDASSPIRNLDVLLDLVRLALLCLLTSIISYCINKAITPSTVLTACLVLILMTFYDLSRAALFRQ